MSDAKLTGGGEFKNSSDSSSLSAAVFFVFTIMGGLFIIAAKSLGYSQIIVTSIPVSIMLIYALIAASARRLRLRDDQSGDNLYYMGFLFTLVSLGVSLFQFSILEGVEEIIRNFGVAISTTMVGIALRIVFNILRQDPVEIERTARLELADAARRVRRELDATVIEFGFFRRSAQQSINDGFVELGQKMEETSNILVEGLKRSLSSSSEPLQVASLKSGEAIDAVTTTMVRSLEASASKLAEHTARLAMETETISERLGQLAQNLQAIQTPEKVIEIKLNPTIQGIAKAVAALDKSLSANLSKMDENFSQIRGLVDETSRSLNGTRIADSANVQALIASLQSMQNSTNSVAQTVLNANADNSKQMREAIEKHSGLVTKLVESLQRMEATNVGQSQRMDKLLDAIDRQDGVHSEGKASGRIIWPWESRR